MQPSSDRVRTVCLAGATVRWGQPLVSLTHAADQAGVRVRKWTAKPGLGKALPPRHSSWLAPGGLDRWVVCGALPTGFACGVMLLAAACRDGASAGVRPASIFLQWACCGAALQGGLRPGEVVERDLRLAAWSGTGGLVMV
ncbi:hypothetical protein NDU88_010269 [Pleurodeles waltl]|uniref:Uncharacterized protein n=1 Tax=Pleurodeles waltl TaxID=8319 RepID=A0AAV7S0P8_PLEWA|nr:hypothetical protein NDU88_010269 [Pleurodeles waltl]